MVPSDTDVTDAIDDRRTDHPVPSPQVRASGQTEALAVEFRDAGPGIEIVFLVGELDAFNVGCLRAAMAHVTGAAHRFVALDLSQLCFLDSAGLCALVAIVRRLREEGTRVAVSAPSRGVMRVLLADGFDHVVTLYDSLTEALAALTHITADLAELGGQHDSPRRVAEELSRPMGAPHESSTKAIA